MDLVSYHKKGLLLALLVGLSAGAYGEHRPQRIQGEVQELTRAKSLYQLGEHYQALEALFPLLRGENGGEASREFHEAGLWLANQICEEFVNYNILVKWVDNAFPDRTLEGEFRSAEPYVKLNDLGADIRFDQVSASYIYHYGFLRQLVEKHPDSNRVEAAKYYLIPRTFQDRKQAEIWVAVLEEYIQNHSEAGTPEYVWAHLDLARIHDVLWELIEHPSHFSEGFTSQDKVGDRAYARACRRAALTHYETVLASGFEGRFGKNPRFYIENRYTQLQAKEPENALWVLYE